MSGLSSMVVRGMLLFVCGVCIFPLVAFGADLFPVVLTDNATGDEPSIETGVTYKTDQPYNDPHDTVTGGAQGTPARRLLDGDPVLNWLHVVGINSNKDQNVTFDFRAPYRFTKYSVRFTMPAKPQYVDVSVSEGEQGAWAKVGRITPGVEKEGEPHLVGTGWFDLAVEPPVTGRYINLFFKLRQGGWYVNEVKFWGTRPGEAAADMRIPEGECFPSKFLYGRGVRIPLLKEGKKLFLVKDGQAGSSIIIARDASPKVLKHTRFLQTTVEQMTGVRLLLRDDSQGWEGGQILIGPSKLNDVTVPQGSDQPERYRVVVKGRKVSLVGNDAGPYQGTGYAVYDLLERLGCGWYGPDPLWHVIPKGETLSVPPLNVDERPAFLMRNIWMVKPHQVLWDAWRLGGQYIPHGHAYSSLLPPQKYKAEHPDWFGKGQLCLTHPEVIRTIADQFRAHLDEHPGLQSFSLSANDSGGWCTCKRCKAVGNVSAQQMYFANAIARELAKTHPNRYRLCILAYWFAHGPPSPLLKAEPGVVVMLVNEGDHTKPLDEPERPEVARKGRCNTREVKAFTGWRRTGGLTGIYEWWIPGCNNHNWRRLPWYPGETALRNLRYWKRGGIKYLSYETQYEDGNGFPMRWPLYYVGARGMWDPELTSHQIMTEACRKLYGPAAEHMLSFYHTIEEAMAETRESGGNWHLPSPEKVYSLRVERQASVHLKEAAKATDKPAILARIAEERRMWNRGRHIMSGLRSDPHVVRVGDKTFKWSDQTIDAQAIRDILELKPETPLFAVQGNKQRTVEEPEAFDLTKSIRFFTKTP